MTNYRATASGLLGGTLPWSYHMNLQSSNVETTVASNWTNANVTLWNTATDGLKNFMSADVTFTECSVSTLNATFHQTTKTNLATGLPLTGSDANPSLPWSISEVVTLRTAFATKSGHGRIFLPPFAEDQIAAHVIKATTITSMETVFNAFFATLLADGITPFLYNAKTLKDGTLPFTIKLCNGYDLSNKPAQQRRRVSKIVPTRVVGTF
jgi:hypothetical protein